MDNSDVTYNHMPTVFFQDKTIGSLAKLILERIWSLSKDGSQKVFFSRKKYADFFGVNQETVTRAFKELLASGYLEEAVNKNSFDRTKVFKVLKTHVLSDDRKNRHSIDGKTDDRQSGKPTIDSRESQQSDDRKNRRSSVGKTDDLHQIDHISMNSEIKEKESSTTFSSTSSTNSVSPQQEQSNEQPAEAAEVDLSDLDAIARIMAMTDREISQIFPQSQINAAVQNCMANSCKYLARKLDKMPPNQAGMAVIIMKRPGVADLSTHRFGDLVANDIRKEYKPEYLKETRYARFA